MVAGKKVETADGNIVEMYSIHKRFGGVVALNGVSFKLAKSEVHGLIGENGAGKTTLMKILSGATEQDSGNISINGKIVKNPNPYYLRTLGVQIVHQELSLLPHMTVAENMFLGKELRTKSGLIDKERMYIESKHVLDEIEVSISPNTMVEILSTAQKQLVEIAKSMIGDLKVLILDEPTSSLTDKEIFHLKKILDMFKIKGVSVVLISHKLNEVKDMCDKVTVMRDGKVVHTCCIDAIDIQDMVNYMVGRNVNDTYVPPVLDECSKKIVFELKGINSYVFGEVELKDININVRAGEIVGMFGLIGSGRTEIIKTIYGLRRKQSGTVIIDGVKVKKLLPSKIIEQGVSWVPEDRRKDGLCLEMSIKNNIGLAVFGEISKCGFVNMAKHKGIVNDYMNRLAIKAPNSKMNVGSLSGGNQQKVVLAKWLAVRPKVLILDEPTRGIDVGSKAEIHSLIRKLRDEGMAILVISSELPELFVLSDRVIVMKDGVITGRVMRDGTGMLTEENIMRIATIGVNKV